MRSRHGYAVSYAKVELHSRSPRLWGWTLRRDGSDNLLRRSEGGYLPSCLARNGRDLSGVRLGHPARWRRRGGEGRAVGEGDRGDASATQAR